VELTQDKIDLIAKIIKSDRKYSNNEDLYDDFFNETCRRSMAIFDAVDNEATLEAYLKKVVTTSILNVLKDSGRLRRTKTGYMTTKEVPVDTVMQTAEETVTDIAAQNTNKTDYDLYNVNYSNINIPPSPEENAIRNEILDFVAHTIERINRNEPDKKYLELFIHRYQNGMTQKQISHELGISQSEVSKRLFGLIDKVKSVLDEQ
jgi:RNA polymerase sigma factor (sigma-70 family)